MFNFHFDTVVATAVSVMELLEATIIKKTRRLFNLALFEENPTLMLVMTLTNANMSYSRVDNEVYLLNLCVNCLEIKLYEA